MLYLVLINRFEFTKSFGEWHRPVLATQQGKSVHHWMVQHCHLLLPGNIIEIPHIITNFTNHQQEWFLNLAKNFTVVYFVQIRRVNKCSECWFCFSVSFYDSIHSNWLSSHQNDQVSFFQMQLEELGPNNKTQSNEQGWLVDYLNFNVFLLEHILIVLVKLKILTSKDITGCSVTK